MSTLSPPVSTQLASTTGESSQSVEIASAVRAEAGFGGKAGEGRSERSWGHCFSFNRDAGAKLEH